MKVPLLGFENPLCRYELDTASNQAASQEYERQSDAESGTRGLGAYVKVGLRRRKRSFFAFYVQDGRLSLFADGRSFDLASEEIQVRRTFVAPFVKRFSVYQGDHRVCSWTYWFSDLREDGFVPRDFLSYVARDVAPRSNHKTRVLYWEELAAGRDPSRASFQAELSRLLQSEE